LKEISPVSIKQRKGDPKIFDTDEFPKAGVTAEGRLNLLPNANPNPNPNPNSNLNPNPNPNPEGLTKLRPAFKKDGTVTAGNASGINDGAAAVVVMSESAAAAAGHEVLAKIISYASGGVDPAVMGTGPIPASRLALEKAGWTVGDLDLIEVRVRVRVGLELGCWRS